MKLLPDSVTVLPVYATADTADSTAGLALICSSDDALVTLVVDGFEKRCILRAYRAPNRFEIVNFCVLQFFVLTLLETLHTFYLRT